MKKKSAAAASITSGKYFTYNVSVSFEMQFTFHESEVQPAEEGLERDRDPTEKALANLERELTEYIGSDYAISGLSAFADFDSLLGKSELNGEKRPIKLKNKVTQKKIRRK